MHQGNIIYDDFTQDTCSWQRRFVKWEMNFIRKKEIYSCARMKSIESVVRSEHQARYQNRTENILEAEMIVTRHLVSYLLLQLHLLRNQEVHSWNENVFNSTKVYFKLEARI